MKHLFLVLFSLLAVTINYAQKDSLILVLEDSLMFQIENYGENYANAILARQKLAKQYQDDRKYSEAVKIYEEILKAQGNIGIELIQKAQTYFDLSTNYWGAGRLEEALLNISKSIEIRSKELNRFSPLVIKTYSRLGNIYCAMYQFDKALEIYEEKVLSIQLESIGAEHSDVGDSYLEMSIIYYRQADFTKSIEVLEKALNIYTIENENNLKNAFCYTNLALNYESLGDYALAIELIEKAIVVYKAQEPSVNRTLNLANPYHNLSVIYTMLGNYSKSLNYNLEALKIRRMYYEEGNQTIAASYNAIGNDYFCLEKYDLALLNFYKALNIYKISSSESDLKTANVYLNIAKVHLSLGEYLTALNFYNLGLKSRLDFYTHNHPNIAEVYSDMAYVYSCVKNYGEALLLSQKAIRILVNKLGENHPETISAYINKAKILEIQNNYQEADALWTTVVTQILKRLNDTYLFLPNDQRLEYSKLFEKVYNSFYSFAVKYEQKNTLKLAAHLSLNTKALALDYGISIHELIQNINNKELKLVYDELLKLNKELSQAELLTISEQKQKNIDLSFLRDKHEKLSRKLLQNEHLDRKLIINQLSCEELQDKIEPDEAIIDFIRFQDVLNHDWKYYAVIIRNDVKDPQFIHLVNEKSITSLFESNSKNGQPSYIQNSKQIKALYSKVWQPLAPYLKNTKTIHLSLAGLLHRINFEALQDENEAYLASRYKFHYYTSLRGFGQKENVEIDILAKEDETQKQNVILLGDLSYDVSVVKETDVVYRDGIDPLPATKEEIQKVVAIIEKSGGTSIAFTESAATENIIQNYIGLKSPDIFHFATHAKYLSPQDSLENTGAMQDRLRVSGNPLQRSMLLLSGSGDTWSSKEYIPRSDQDGILTAYEVSHLDLSNTKLAVLSACNTGLGVMHDTEGVLGLQTAFKLAGVSHVIVSLWKVNDVATKELMILFYENLFIEKQSISAALRNAKTTMRNKGAKPENWAGFILIE